MSRRRVLEVLDSLPVRYAVIGAVAVAARGAPRSTLDLDLLTTDPRVLRDSAWEELRRSGAVVDIRKGDQDDPLAGVVRIRTGSEHIDIIVGRSRWESQVIERAEAADVEGNVLPIARASDLILLKLAAGGPIDRQDIMRLLAVGPREQLIAEVDDKIGDLPADAASLWRKIVAERA